MLNIVHGQSVGQNWIDIQHR